MLVGRVDNLPDSIVNILCRLRCEELFAEVRVGADLDGPCGVVDSETLQTRCRPDELAEGTVSFEIIV